MKRNILKAISTIEEFNIKDYIDLNIGIEIQDFTESNLSDDEIREIVEGYVQAETYRLPQNTQYRVV